MPSHMRALPKPKPGSATAMRRARTRLAHARERAAKDAAKARDGYRCRRCHVPHCGLAGYPERSACEAAHLIDKGMGGDHGRHSNEAKHYVTLCRDCHQGPRSVHSGHVRIVFDPVKMGDGRVSFVKRDA